VNDSIAARIERIKTNKITKSQQKLLQYFENMDYQQIMYMSITELAEATKVAEATILRFCRFLGFKGYQEFRLNLAQEVSNVNVKPVNGVEYANSIIDNYHLALENCRKCLSASSLKKLFDYILSARTVCCCGVGNSYVAALELHNRLMKMGILTQCEHDMHFQNILVSSCDEKDILIIFSISGGTKDVIETAALARTHNMKIILITCHDRSPMTKLSDLVLSVTPMETPNEPGAMSSKIMQLFMVDVICEGLRLKDTERFNAYLARSSAATVGKLILY
jgi:DNA-binding MurR/RpiR family transcriptional regulator